MITVPYQQVYDGTTARPINTVANNPAADELLTVAAQNRRVVRDQNGLGLPVADLGVTPRSAKNIVWSSEGFVFNGVTYNALTTTQKKTTSSSSTTLATSQSLPNVAPNVITVPANLDVSAYGGGLMLVVNLTAITGTSIQFEYDLVDDAPTPNVVALWKPTALTAAGGYIVTISPGATGTTPSAPSGWTFTNVAMPQGVQGRFAWTATSVTACTWTAILYGLN